MRRLDLRLDGVLIGLLWGLLWGLLALWEPAWLVGLAGSRAWAADVPGRFPEASTRLLRLEDLASRDLPTLSLMRNEVFARHGHRFKSPSLAQHFEQQSWYAGEVDDASSLLSDIERKNVALIRQVERQKKEAQARQEEEEARQAMAKLPAEVQEFWARFRVALNSGSAARVAALTSSDFRDGLDAMLRTGRSQRVGRAELSRSLSYYLPPAIIARMLRQAPSYEGGVLRFYSGEQEDDEVTKVGRIYRFARAASGFQLYGVYVAAGPGDGG